MPEMLFIQLDIRHFFQVIIVVSSYSVFGAKNVKHFAGILLCEHQEFENRSARKPGLCGFLFSAFPLNSRQVRNLGERKGHE